MACPEEQYGTAPFPTHTPSLSARIKVRAFAAFSRYYRARRQLHRMGIRLPQHDREFGWFCNLIARQSPKRYLEIGSRDGASLWMVSAFLPPGATIVTVDFPGKDAGSVRSAENLNYIHGLLQERGFKTLAVFGDSRDCESKTRASEFTNHQPLDVLFIDGDHTYEGVRADWELYSPMVKKGGIVGFHDLILSPRFPNVQVGRLFNELATQYKTERRQCQYGVGIVHIPENHKQTETQSH